LSLAPKFICKRALGKYYKLEGIISIMEYATPGKRKSKNDKRAKGRYSRYKKGGKWRTETAKKKKTD